jgi:hypothetical protein
MMKARFSTSSFKPDATKMQRYAFATLACPICTVVASG